MTRHRPTAERRAQILDAARQCMLERGYQATKVAEIAAAAGLSKGAVYFHFDNKRALVAALVEREFEKAYTVVEAAHDIERPSLFTLATVFAQAFLSDPSDPGGRFLLLTGEIGVLDEILRERICALHDGLIDGLALLLTSWAKAEGLFLPDPRAAAAVVKAISDGLQVAFAFGVPLDINALVPITVTMIEQGLRTLGAPR